QLAFVAGAQLPVLALGLMYSSEIVGFFAMAHRVAALPLQAASQSFSEAMLRRTISQHHQQQRMRPGVQKAAIALLSSGLPIFSAMFFFGADLLTWFLGQRWAEAGSILEILAVYLFFYWIAAPFYPLLEALRKNKAQLLLY